jgi:O-acetyl-ADP-ribose deacetylase (regulator of RNase III)
VETRVAETEVNRDIVELIEDSPNELFCFFPVWSAGEYMFDLVKATNERLLVSRAALRLDHEMRLRHIFTNAGLSQDAVKRHLGSLRKQRFQLAEKPPPATREVDVALRASSRRVGLGLRVQYADITSRSAMADAEFGGVRRAVVSPEDTFVSAGGGVAYQLLEKAGSEALLNELAKFAPIPQGTVAVTSGGALPVHHVFHAASIEVGPTGEYLASKADVTETMVDVLRKAAALGVGVVWVPLLAAGVASLGQRASFEGLLEGLRAWLATAAEPTVPLTVAIVVYQERELPRHEVREVFGATLGDEFVLDPAAPAPEAEPTPS